MTEEVLLDAEERMDKAITAFEHALATVRTGRANTALIEHLQVMHYGQSMPLNQLATLSTPDAQLITVQPWDKGALDSVMRALQQSDIGITPSTDGSIIRLPIPPLTEQRRKDLVKQVHTKTEEARVAIRNVRRHAIEGLRKSLKDGVSEDEERRAEDEIEKLTSRHVERVEAMAKGKEQELLEV